MVRLRKALGRTGRFVRTETLGRVGERIERRREYQQELKKARKAALPEAARLRARQELIEKPMLRAQVEKKRLLAASRRASRRVASPGGLGLDPSGGLEFLTGIGPSRRRARAKRRRPRKKRRATRAKTITFRVG